MEIEVVVECHGEGGKEQGTNPVDCNEHNVRRIRTKHPLNALLGTEITIRGDYVLLRLQDHINQKSVEC